MEEKDFKPSYIQIQDYIINSIQTGRYKTGDKLPSEIEIAEIFNVNRNTANKALKELELMGIITRVRGKGSFVTDSENVPSATKVLSKNLYLKSFGDKYHELKECRFIELPDILLEKFNLPKGSKGYEIIRYLNHIDSCVAVDFSYFSPEIIGNIEINKEKLERSYLHNYLKEYTTGLNSPSYIKIYINTPKYDFLNIENYFNHDDPTLIWTTDILNKNKHIIATTITISKDNFNDRSFISFSIA